MFGDLMGNMKARQEELANKLREIEVIGNAPGQAVVVKANGNKEILNIEIDPGKLDMNDKEQLEDYLMLALNEALGKASEEAEKLSQQMINDILPGGLGGLSNLFG